MVSPRSESAELSRSLAWSPPWNEGKEEGVTGGKRLRAESEKPTPGAGHPLGVAVRHVVWIGGAPVSGKTSIATRIGRRHGLRWYGADMRTWDHRDRAIAAGVAAAIRWEEMTPEERWEKTTPAEKRVLSLHRERGPMVVDDLRALPRSPLVLAEGSTLPAAAAPRDPARAVWLIPTREFHRTLLARRRLSPGVREAYLAVTETIEREAGEHAAPILVVDGSRGIDATVAEVEDRFARTLAEGPVAKTLAERRALLRDANEAIVVQVRGYHARPWAEGDADAHVRSFLCECGDRLCDASVDVPVARAAASPVLARGHTPARS